MGVERLMMYRTAAEVANEVRVIAIAWPVFDQRALGDQLVRAADSVVHNIAEMDGRSTTGEKLQFYNYANGSIQEARSALTLAASRNLIHTEMSSLLRRKLSGVSFQLLAYVGRILDADPSYNGRLRVVIERRRARLSRLRSPDRPSLHPNDT